MKRLLPFLAAGVAAVGAVYELVAVVTGWVPTITEMIQPLPAWAELALIGVPLAVFAGWVCWHFGWFTRGDRPPFGTDRSRARAARRAMTRPYPTTRITGPHRPVEVSHDGGKTWEPWDSAKPFGPEGDRE